MLRIRYWPFVLALLCAYLLLKSISASLEEARIIRVSKDYYQLRDLCRDFEIEFPEVVASQIILETGYLTSDIYEVNHNLFGIKNHKNTPYCIPLQIRPDSIYVDSILRKVDNIHCFYLDEQASIMDYKEYQKSKLAFYKDCTKKEIRNAKDYLDFLEDIKLPQYGCKYPKKFRYAEDLKYRQKLMKLLKKYEKDNFNLIMGDSSHIMGSNYKR